MVWSLWVTNGWSAERPSPARIRLHLGADKPYAFTFVAGRQKLDASGGQSIMYCHDSTDARVDFATFHSIQRVQGNNCFVGELLL